MLSSSDKDILRSLAARIAEIAALPQQEEKRTLWRKLNGLAPERPMVMIDQIPWNELRDADELTLQCKDDECRNYEQYMRRILYQWNHFPVDMVVENYIPVHRAVTDTGFGVVPHEQIACTDVSSEVMAHAYTNQFETDDDLDKIQTPRVTHDTEETARRFAVAHEIFDGIMPIKPRRSELYYSLWDPISTWMSVEKIFYMLIDRPAYMHELVCRVRDGYMAMIDQWYDLGILPEPQHTVHCCGAYSDQLPAPGFDPAKPRTEDVWMFGMAQVFSTISPQMFNEFEIEYMLPICARFGKVYYGCCEPLDSKMNEVRRLPNVRKISMSPWADQERGAQEICGEYVFSRKPNPAQLATETFHPDAVRKDLQNTVDICAQNGCPVELILKDISTIRYQPQRLDEWARIAMDIAQH